MNTAEVLNPSCNLYFVICRVLGHRYEITRVITPQIRELRCKRCSKLFGMNDDVRALLPLDKELIDAHNVLINGV